MPGFPSTSGCARCQRPLEVSGLHARPLPPDVVAVLRRASGIYDDADRPAELRSDRDLPQTVP